MSKKKYIQEKVYHDFERPRLVSWFSEQRPRWIVMEPAPLAMFAASCCAFFALVILFVRQLGGAMLSPLTVLVSVALTFVVAYTLVGLFVYYLLCVAERELWQQETVDRGGSEEDVPDNGQNLFEADEGEE